MKIIINLFRVFLIAAFAMWFGGFGFYVSFVVPIGNEVLGSAFEQGMITRRATVPLNHLCAIAICAMLIESAITWRTIGRGLKISQMGCVTIILLTLIALYILHPRIDQMIDLTVGEIQGDYDQFYFLHRIYLWASTVQWFAAWGWLICFSFGFQSKRHADAVPSQ